MPQTYAGERTTNPSTSYPRPELGSKAGQVLVDVCYLNPQVASEYLVFKLCWELVHVRVGNRRIVLLHKRRPILRALPFKARHRQVNDPVIAQIGAELVYQAGGDR